MNTYLEQETLSFPVPVTVADIFGNGNNLDETRASRQQLPRRPPRTPHSRRIACPIVPDNPESNGTINDKIRIKPVCSLSFRSRLTTTEAERLQESTCLCAVIGTLASEEATLR